MGWLFGSNHSVADQNTGNQRVDNSRRVSRTTHARREKIMHSSAVQTTRTGNGKK